MSAATTPSAMRSGDASARSARPARRANLRRSLLAAALLTIALLFACAASASAAPSELWTKCDKSDPFVRCSFPRGVAANSSNGHIFVADQNNVRIEDFNALGQFIRAWGWDVVQSGPGNTGTGFEVCVPKDGDVCKEGAEGNGAGEFGSFGPQGVALDRAGNVYVVDLSNRRVEKFAPNGQFLLAFGSSGTGNGQFGAWKVGSFIAIDSSDKIYVGDQERIQRFDVSGAYQSQCFLPVGMTVQGLAADRAGDLYATYSEKPDVHKIEFVSGGACKELTSFKLPKTGVAENVEAVPTAVAVDGTGDVLAVGPTCSVCAGTVIPIDPIHEFDPSGKEIDHWGKEEIVVSTGLATNLCAESEAPGNVYATNAANGTGPPHSKEAFLRAYGTQPIGCFKARTLPATNVAETTATLHGTVNPDGSLPSECRFEYGTSETYGSEAPCLPASLGEGTKPIPVHADLGPLTKGTVYHFRLVAKIGGETETGSDESFKTLGPPVISAEGTLGATYTEASVRALVTPEGFATSYHFDYGTTEAYGQSTPVIGIGFDRTAHAVLASLTGLDPGTTYHWRIVAANSSGTSSSTDHTLTTYRSPQPPAPCANDALRSGPSAFLPDCRAYEMVSPVDKNGGDIAVPGEEGGNVRSTTDGDKLTYSTIGSFGDQPNAFYNNQYIATRGGGGWSNEGIHPPVTGKAVNSVLFGLEREFMAFTPDLCSAWLVDFQTPPPTADGQQGRPNLYRRDNCEAGEGSLEALTPSPPALPEGTPEFYVDNTSLQGVSEDGRHAIFVAAAPLPQVPEAAPGNKAQIYDRSAGELSLVSILPDGTSGDPAPGNGSGFPDPASSAVGNGWAKNLYHAVSTDGSRVFWTDGGGEGTIYLRRHPEQGIVAGECSEASKACTIKVSGSALAFFWTASADGTRALYTEFNSLSGKEELFLFEEGAPRRKLAKDAEGVVGASEDLSHVYFVSRSKLGPQKNKREEEATVGEPNLYLDSEGTLSFITTVAAGDIERVDPGAQSNAYSLVNAEAHLRATRVSADGTRLAFESRAPLTGYDNTAQGSGAAAVEVYLYDAASGELHCVSCNPSGARPLARELTPPYEPTDSSPTKVQAAAWISTWQQPLYPTNVLSSKGGRLFFNSNDSLLPRDTNGAQDVYEWEAPDVGTCSEEDSSYFPQNGGCLALISSGESPQGSEFWEASPDGADVFFITASSLLPADPGSIDLYDARVEGGFPASTAAAACEGEACQPPPPPPDHPTPATSTLSGEGNVVEPTPKPKSCRKPKVRKHGRCVKRHGKAKHRHRHRAATNNRRAAR